MIRFVLSFVFFYMNFTIWQGLDSLVINLSLN